MSTSIHNNLAAGLHILNGYLVTCSTKDSVVFHHSTDSRHFSNPQLNMSKSWAINTFSICRFFWENMADSQFAPSNLSKQSHFSDCLFYFNLYSRNNWLWSKMFQQLGTTVKTFPLDVHAPQRMTLTVLWTLWWRPKPQITMHFTTYSCDIKTFSPLPCLQKCVLSWFIPFEFDSFKNQTIPTVSCADLIALLSPLTHSEVSHVAHVIKQNWSASCCRCRSCRYTVTWLPLCLGSLLSLGVALVAGTRRGNSSMVLLQSWNITTTLKHWFHVQPLVASVFLWGKSCCATCRVLHVMVRLSVLLLYLQ